MYLPPICDDKKMHVNVHNITHINIYIYIPIYITAVRWPWRFHTLLLYVSHNDNINESRFTLLVFNDNNELLFTYN